MCQKLKNKRTDVTDKGLKKHIKTELKRKTNLKESMTDDVTMYKCKFTLFNFQSNSRKTSKSLTVDHRE